MIYQCTATFPLQSSVVRIHIGALIKLKYDTLAGFDEEEKVKPALTKKIEGAE